MDRIRLAAVPGGAPLAQAIGRGPRGIGRRRSELSPQAQNPVRPGRASSPRGRKQSLREGQRPADARRASPTQRAEAGVAIESAPRKADENDRCSPSEVPTKMYEAVPMVPPIKTG